MNIQRETFADDKEIENKLDDQEIIDYTFKDKIHNEKVNVQITRETAKYLENSRKQMRRSQNAYNHRVASWDTVFNEDNMENEKYIADNRQNPEYVTIKKQKEARKAAIKEQRRALVENALCCLTDTQREVIDLIFYENKSERQIAKLLGITPQAVHERREKAIRRLKNFILSTQN